MRNKDDVQMLSEAYKAVRTLALNENVNDPQMKPFIDKAQQIISQTADPKAAAKAVKELAMQLGVNVDAAIQQLQSTGAPAEEPAQQQPTQEVDEAPVEDAETQEVLSAINTVLEFLNGSGDETPEITSGLDSLKSLL